MKKSFLKLGLAAAAVFAMSTSANAAINFTALGFDDPGVPALIAGQKLVTDFDTGSSPATLAIAKGYSFNWCSNGCSTTAIGDDTNQSGAYDNVSLISGIASRPQGSANSGTGSPGQYLAIMGSDGGAATLTSAKALESLSLLWGSVDSYNFISFYSGSTPIPLILGGTFSGSDVTAPNPADGNQTSPLTNLEVKFTIPKAYDVTEVVFSSTGNSFELDNLRATVPEPRTWIMLILGFGLIGLMLRRRTASPNLAA